MTVDYKQRAHLRRELAKLRDKYGGTLFDAEIKRLATDKFPLPPVRKVGKPKTRSNFLLRRVWVEVMLQKELYNLSADKACKRLADKGGFEFESIIVGEPKEIKIDTTRKIKDWFYEAQKLYESDPRRRIVKFRLC